MNWDAIGAIGEIVGAGAVVATLAYLAVQTRRARMATEAQNTLSSRWRLIGHNAPLVATLDIGKGMTQTFEYLVGIHAIVLGLATAYLLTTLADTIKYRATISHYWVHTAWCVLLQLLLIGGGMACGACLVVRPSFHTRGFFLNSLLR